MHPIKQSLAGSSAGFGEASKYLGTPRPDFSFGFTLKILKDNANTESLMIIEKMIAC